MADQKDQAQDKKKDEHASGHGTKGGNMGAGKSGKEGMGSQKPGGSGSK